MKIKDCRLIDLPQVDDARGCLTVVEDNGQLAPFKVERIFWINGIPEGCERGGHAHYTIEELIVPVAGHFSVTVDDGQHRHTFLLDHPGRALYVSPCVWVTLHDFSADAVCLCLASKPYSTGEYIRNYEQFKAFVQPHQ